MKKFTFFAVICLLITTVFAFSSCSKDETNASVPSFLIGTWNSSNAGLFQKDYVTATISGSEISFKYDDDTVVKHNVQFRSDMSSNGQYYFSVINEDGEYIVITRSTDTKVNINGNGSFALSFYGDYSKK